MPARYLSTLILAALLAACATPSPSLQGVASADDGPIVAATLAPLGSFEWRAAPSWTRLILIRKQAARDLRADRITLTAAQAVLTRTDEARGELDRATAASSSGQPAEARAGLLRANRALDTAQLLLGAPR